MFSVDRIRGAKKSLNALINNWFFSIGLYCTDDIRPLPLSLPLSLSLSLPVPVPVPVPGGGLAKYLRIVLHRKAPYRFGSPAGLGGFW